MIEDLSSDCQCCTSHYPGTTIACNYGNRTYVPNLLEGNRSYRDQESWKSLVVLGNSSIITFPIDYFRGIKNIETLSFHGIGLHSIPNIFLNLQQVYTMDLSGNEIEIISTLNIQKLGVRLLNLSHNSIKDLKPDDLSWIPSIEILDLSNNKITKIPKGFFSATKLIRKVILSFNSLKVISKHTLSGLEVTLQDLYLGENQIDSIHPMAFRHLHELKLLDLSGNLFNQKSDVLSSLKLPHHIAHLDLKRTGLKTFSYCFVYDLHDLEFIDLQENNLKCSCDLVWVRQHLRLHHYSSRGSQPEQLRVQCLGTVNSTNSSETLLSLEKECRLKGRKPCLKSDPKQQLLQQLQDLHYVVEIRKGKIWMHWDRLNSSMIYAYRITVKEDGKEDEFFYGPVTIHPSSDQFVIESFELENIKLIVCLHVMANTTDVLYNKCTLVEDESLRGVVGILAGVIFLVPCIIALTLVVYYDRKHKREQKSNKPLLKTVVIDLEGSKDVKAASSLGSCKSIADVEDIAEDKKSIVDVDSAEITRNSKVPSSDIFSSEESEDLNESISLLSLKSIKEDDVSSA
jgi:hypothetical protein